jgi:HSP20 family protein
VVIVEGERMASNRKSDVDGESGTGGIGGIGGLGGIFKSLGGFMELLSNLAEKDGGEIHRSGELGNNKGVKAVYGFSVRMGGGGMPQVEHFGNVKDMGNGAVVEETREPLVDIFDEDDYLLLIAELPGVGSGDIHFEVEGDVLTLYADKGDRKYRKEILLPAAVLAEGATPSFRNGVFELKLKKA